MSESESDSLEEEPEEDVASGSGPGSLDEAESRMEKFEEDVDTVDLRDDKDRERLRVVTEEGISAAGGVVEFGGERSELKTSSDSVADGRGRGCAAGPAFSFEISD